MMEKYEFGRIVIDGKTYTDDIRIIDGKVLPKWWKTEGHFLEKKGGCWCIPPVMLNNNLLISL